MDLQKFEMAFEKIVVFCTRVEIAHPYTPETANMFRIIFVVFFITLSFVLVLLFPYILALIYILPFLTEKKRNSQENSSKMVMNVKRSIKSRQISNKMLKPQICT